MSRVHTFWAATALLALPLAAHFAAAANPAASSVTVPETSGQTVVAEWTGLINPGANATSDCSSLPDAPFSDIHQLNITVPDNLYKNLDARFSISITWPDAFNDEILTVRASDGATLDSSDGGSNVELVNLSNLTSDTYDVMACAFASGEIVEYQGRLVVTTADRDTLASAPAAGLEFSASVATENQRDESEPLVEIDDQGNIYACGPSGSSQQAEYMSVSTDGGESYHLVGVPPRGQMAAGGGGDCAMAFGFIPNSEGYNDLAYSGLGPLTGFATSISPDNGHRFATAGFNLTGGVTNLGAVADRQWLTFVSENEVLMTYNQQQPRNTVVLRSTDKGLNYNVGQAVAAAASPRFPGPIRYNPDYGNEGLVYFAWDDTGSFNGNAGDFVMLSVSRDRGHSWNVCNVAFNSGSTTLFASADHDNAGNIYISYGEDSQFHTYVRMLDVASIAKCDRPANTAAGASIGSGGPGAIFRPPVQVDRDDVRTSLFQWVTAGGAPGHVAVTFLGTETDGNPNVGSFKASWDVYVNVSTNMLSTDALNPPTFSQVKATTHPMHYDSVCINGLSCDTSVPPGDRSMADFMAIDYNRATGKLTAVFNRTNKKPGEASGHVATTMAVTQTGGPSLAGGTLIPVKPVLRSSDTDPTGDALSAYSIAAIGAVPPEALLTTRNEPAADFVSVSVGPEIDLISGEPIEDGGFTVTLGVSDLSDAALIDTSANTQSKSLLWIFRFTNGYQDVAASARWNLTDGFTYGYNDYTVGDSPCSIEAGATEKCLLYPGDTPIQGDVNQQSGEIRLSVPRSLLKGLSGSTGHGERPKEVNAEVGTRFYDGTAWSLGNVVSTRQDVQSFLYPFDSTPAFDFLLSEGGDDNGTGCHVSGNGKIPSAFKDGKFSLVATPDLQGNVMYRDKQADLDFRSTSLTSVVCNGYSATITGIGVNDDEDIDNDGDSDSSSDGDSDSDSDSDNDGDSDSSGDGDSEGDKDRTPITFTVQVNDAGEPGDQDTFAIELSNGYAADGQLTKGNIVVRRDEQ